MKQEDNPPIINSNSLFPSPKALSASTYWESFIKDTQLTSFTIKEDQSLEFSFFEESPIFNGNPKGNLRKIKSRIKTILNTSSFPQDMVKTTKKAYKSNPQFMHLAIDRTDFSDMKIFDVLDEEFESIRDLEDKKMLNRVEDEEFNWWIFGTCKDINFINAHEKELEEDDGFQRPVPKKNKKAKKKEAKSAKLKEKNQENHIKGMTELSYWERDSTRRRGPVLMNNENDDENKENCESSEEELDLIILIEVDESDELEKEKQENSLNQEEEEEAVVLVELEEDELEHEEEHVVLIELEEDEIEEMLEEYHRSSEVRRSSRIKAKKGRKRRGRERVLNEEMGYVLVNGKRRRASSSEKREASRKFDFSKLTRRSERLIWSERQNRR